MSGEMPEEMPISDQQTQRELLLAQWFAKVCAEKGLGTPESRLEAVSGDASFRRYFRGHTELGHWILVDAPPDKEDSRPFVAVARRLGDAGVLVPDIIAADLTQGLMCLQDFGSVLLWEPLEMARLAGDQTGAGSLYQQAFDQLLQIQCCDAAQTLPCYSEALLQREMLLFNEWFCGGILGLELTVSEKQMLDELFDLLRTSALTQPQCFVHRDYHSRNLMLLDHGVGVIDFQDAVLGPLTYDLVSLLKDCYIVWPEAEVEGWVSSYFEQAKALGLTAALSLTEFGEALHLMGLQRHLKVAGIFSRLWLRDGKPGYLQDIPRTLSYMLAVQTDEPVVNRFIGWLHEHVMPILAERTAISLQKPAQSAGSNS